MNTFTAGSLKGVAALALTALVSATTSLPALADHDRGWHGHSDYRGGYRGGYRQDCCYRGHDNHGGLIVGALLGAAVGAAIIGSTAQPAYAPPPAVVYSEPPPPPPPGVVYYPNSYPAPGY